MSDKKTGVKMGKKKCVPNCLHICEQLSWSHYRLLISFDKDYRLVVSKEIKDHYTDAAAKSYFIDREGQKMSLPVKFLPSQKLLKKHSELLVG